MFYWWRNWGPERNAVLNSSPVNIRGCTGAVSSFYHNPSTLQEKGFGERRTPGPPLSNNNECNLLGLTHSFLGGIQSQSCCLCRVLSYIQVDTTSDSEDRFSHIKLQFIETSVRRKYNIPSLIENIYLQLRISCHMYYLLTIVTHMQRTFIRRLEKEACRSLGLSRILWQKWKGESLNKTRKQNNIF